LEACRRHLADSGRDLSDSDLTKLRDQLYTLASVAVRGVLRADTDLGRDSRSLSASHRADVELLTYCSENKHDVHALIVYNISRFARDRFDHVVFRAQLHKLGITSIGV
jgi:hypothetical protein